MNNEQPTHHPAHVIDAKLPSGARVFVAAMDAKSANNALNEELAKINQGTADERN